jgi:Trk K+ transport system NAD-binding subunit
MLADAKEDVVLIDADARLCNEAENDGFRVLYGNALEERILLGAEMESRKAAVGLLFNEATNLLFAEKAREYKVANIYVGVQKGYGSIEPQMVKEAGGVVLFADKADLELWSVRARREMARVELWSLPELGEETEIQFKASDLLLPEVQNDLLPLAIRRKDDLSLFDDTTKLKSGDELFIMLFEERIEMARAWLEERDLKRIASSSDHAS